jgi:hypothetical protein
LKDKPVDQEKLRELLNRLYADDGTMGVHEVDGRYQIIGESRRRYSMDYVMRYARENSRTAVHIYGRDGSTQVIVVDK